jgi:hypothetical protein
MNRRAKLLLDDSPFETDNYWLVLLDRLNLAGSGTAGLRLS